MQLVCLVATLCVQLLGQCASVHSVHGLLGQCVSVHGAEVLCSRVSFIACGRCSVGRGCSCHSLPVGCSCHSLPVGGAQWGGDALRKHQLADGFVYPSAGVGTSHLKLVCVRGSKTTIIKHHILKHHILELRNIYIYIYIYI